VVQNKVLEVQIECFKIKFKEPALKLDFAEVVNEKNFDPV